MTQAVSRRGNTAKDRVRSQPNSCELRGENKKADRRVSECFILLLVQFKQYSIFSIQRSFIYVRRCKILACGIIIKQRILKIKQHI